MIALFKNRLAYLSVSLILLIIAFPLISIGMSTGPTLLWWLGLIALGCGGLIPPLQRILLGPPPSAAVLKSGPDQGSIDCKGTK